MDPLGIAIIVVSVALALLFKWFIFKWIRSWIDQDLLRSLAAGDPTRLQALTELDEQLRLAKVSRQDRHHQLEQRAASLQGVDID